MFFLLNFTLLCTCLFHVLPACSSVGARARAAAVCLVVLGGAAAAQLAQATRNQGASTVCHQPPLTVTGRGMSSSRGASRRWQQRQQHLSSTSPRAHWKRDEQQQQQQRWRLWHVCGGAGRCCRPPAGASPQESRGQLSGSLSSTSPRARWKRDEQQQRRRQ
jgi:hypothetical protein